jgi:hypothetical protein
MGLLAERDGADDGYEAEEQRAEEQGAEEHGAGEHGAGKRSAGEHSAGERSLAERGVTLHRRSVLPTRRAVLYVHGQPGTFVPEDLVTWYTERGFHFYVVDLRPPDRPGHPDQPGRRKSRGGGEALGRLDLAGRHLRDAEGIDMVMVTAHGADALTAAQWCAQRPRAGRADALILSSPEFGRKLRCGLDIDCPVLVLSSGREPEGRPGRLAPWGRRTPGTAVRLGAHVTWLRIDDATDPAGAATAQEQAVKAYVTADSGAAADAESAGEPGADSADGPAGDPGAGPAGDSAGDRRRFFDELGRWLGAYMYGSVRDQLL